MVFITIVTGANLNQLITGGPHNVHYVDYDLNIFKNPDNMEDQRIKLIEL